MCLTSKEIQELTAVSAVLPELPHLSADQVFAIDAKNVELN